MNVKHKAKTPSIKNIFIHGHLLTEKNYARLFCLSREALSD